MDEEGIRIEGEVEGGASLSPQVAEEKQLEKARSKGWRPVEEFKGDAGDWVDYKEFLGREKLFDKIHDLKNQLSRQSSKFEQDMSRISAHFAKVQEVEYNRAKKELEGQLAQAKAAGEVEAVAEIAGQIKEVEADAKQAARDVKVAQQGPTPDFIEWQSNNQWFQKDAEMTTDAIAIGTGYAAANPGKTQKDILDYTTSKIKRMYPEKFEQGAASRKVESDNRVEGGATTRVVSKKKDGLSWSDLSDMEKQVAQTLIKRGALKEIAAKNKRSQQDEYIAQLAARKAAE